MIARIPPLAKNFRGRPRKLFFFSGPFFVSRLMLLPPPENKIATDLIFPFGLFIKNEIVASFWGEIVWQISACLENSKKKHPVLSIKSAMKFFF